MTPLALFKTSEVFNRNNILFKEINRAGHFPWIENSNEIIKVFDDFLARLIG